MLESSEFLAGVSLSKTFIFALYGVFQKRERDKKTVDRKM